jgi:putative phosphoribosyl transferase
MGNRNEDDRKENDLDRRESGLPGGGAGRKDETGGSGVYPASGPYPAGDAEVREQASWGQGVRGAAGYEDHGSSGLIYEGGQVLGGYSAEDRHRQNLSVRIPADGVTLEGVLNVPEELRGVVLFAHGSGSSRHSPRNQYVSDVLRNAGMATLLVDLLTEEEESGDRETARLRFDIELLATRLLHAKTWLIQQPLIKEFTLGYFGASTGAAAALVAASQAAKDAGAVVSRGGRPDLAGPALGGVQAPTLLIVGGNDPTVLDLNRDAMTQLRCEKRLEIVPGATHLFEESGTLEEVARLAREWFEQKLGRRTETIRAA